MYRTERLEFPGQLNEEDLVPGLVIKRVEPRQNGFDDLTVISIVSRWYTSDITGHRFIDTIWHQDPDCRCTREEIWKVQQLLEFGEYKGKPKICGAWLSATLPFLLGLGPKGGDFRADEWYGCYLLPVD